MRDSRKNGHTTSLASEAAEPAEIYWRPLKISFTIEPLLELPLFFLSTLVTTGFASKIWLTYFMSLSLVTLVSDHSKGFSDLLHFSPLDQPPISKITLLNMG